MQTQSLTNKIGMQKMNSNTITYAQDRKAKGECKHDQYIHVEQCDTNKIENKEIHVDTIVYTQNGKARLYKSKQSVTHTKGKQ